MTLIAYHLLCDCKTAVNAYSCPVGILKPTVLNQYDYYRCNYCNYDYICDHSIKIEFTYDDKGLPEQNTIVCGRCGTQVEVHTWPLDSESIDNVYVSRYISIYKRNY
ncbi:MAG: hypothetical protein H7641_10435 [Candidatus Heimdallarchaeota archaeon]|nr:hypothetical protein [Candidatus Heimdallarchaeota archaeon]MCK4877978.1 hypothetical protein [Candidatus Heimdallarchaeota archaeon]